MKIVSPTPDGIAQAAAALRNGEVIGYPTETVYGLGADPFSPAAIERLFAAKGRSENNPVLLIVADREQLAAVTSCVPPEAEPYISRFWPGPLTLLFPRHRDLSDGLTAGAPLIGVRCPDSSIARDICRAFGGAVTSTSANSTGEPPAVTAAEIRLSGVSLVVDGGVLGNIAPSTVFNPMTGVVFREGAISRETLLGI